MLLTKKPMFQNLVTLFQNLVTLCQMLSRLSGQRTGKWTPNGTRPVLPLYCLWIFLRKSSSSFKKLHKIIRQDQDYTYREIPPKMITRRGQIPTKMITKRGLVGGPLLGIRFGILQNFCNKCYLNLVEVEQEMLSMLSRRVYYTATQQSLRRVHIENIILFQKKIQQAKWMRSGTV